MRVFFLGIMLALGLLVLPSSASAQEAADQDGFQLRVNGAMAIPATETVDDLVLISGDAVIAGHVRSSLLVIDGDATVTGRVDGPLTIVRGTLTLEPGASVSDISLINSELVRGEGVSVSGTVHDDTWSWAAAQAGVQAFSILFWFAMTLAVVLAAFAFAWLARRQLDGAVSSLQHRVGETALASLILWVGLPLAAVLAVVTIIGLPTGLAVLFVVLPVLWFLGYLVFGMWFGTLVARFVGQQSLASRPILTAVVGVFLLQVIGLVPVIGGLVLLIGGALGSGALVLRAFTGRSRRRGSAPVAPLAGPVVGPA